MYIAYNPAVLISCIRIGYLKYVKWLNNGKLIVILLLFDNIFNGKPLIIFKLFIDNKLHALYVIIYKDKLQKKLIYNKEVLYKYESYFVNAIHPSCYYLHYI